MTVNEEDRGGHRDAVVYSEKLLGLEDECSIGGCRAAETSTGWLLYHGTAKSWMIGFRCPAHGSGGTWRPEWQPLIDEVIDDAIRGGLDITAAIQEARGGDE